MQSIIVKIAELGFTARGCYRNGKCEKCHVETTTWFWRGKWFCDEDIFEAIVGVWTIVSGLSSETVLRERLELVNHQ
jgi:hypothetical protein